jgi:hypothetical protein
MPVVSTKPVVNLPPVSVTSAMQPELRMSSRIFKEIRNGADGIIKEAGRR